MQTVTPGESRGGGLPPDKLQEHKVNAFISAVGRARWFLLTTIVVSAIVMAQTYVEWTQCEAQRMALTMMQGPLLTVEAKPGQKPADALSDSLAHDLYELQRKRIHTASEIRQLVDEASKIVERRKVVNMLNDVKPENQALATLPFNVPADDFVPLMSLMLTVLSACLWLSARAVVLAVRECEHDTLRDVARLYLLFPISWSRSPVETTGPEQPKRVPNFTELSRSDQWVKIVEWVAVSAPFVALTVATLQFWSTARRLISAGDFNALLHFGLLIGMCGVSFLFVVASVRMARILDEELYQNCSPTNSLRGDSAVTRGGLDEMDSQQRAATTRGVSV